MARVSVANLNPAIDRTLTVERLRAEDRNPVLESREEAGGKGANVARVLHADRVRSTAVTPVGGDAGRRYRRLARGSGVGWAFVPIAGETRVNLTILQRSDRRQTRLNCPGPRLRAAEWAAARRAMREAIGGAGFSVLCGSLPPGAPADAFSGFVRDARRVGIPTLVDADGDALLRALAAGPEWVKPNAFELARALRGHGEQPGRGVHATVAAAIRLRDLGARGVIVSLGARGAVLVDPEAGAWSVRAPRIDAVNTVGAGDVLVGRFIAGLLRGVEPPEALRLAVAAATASVGSAATAHHDPHAAADCAAQTSLRRIRQVVVPVRGRRVGRDCQPPPS